MIVRVLDDEFERFSVGNVLSSDNTRFASLTLMSAQPHRDGLLVMFEEVSDRNSSETLRGTSFLINPDERRHLEDDEFWPEQLVGLRVVDTTGEQIGGVTDLITGAAQDRLVITTPSGTFEAPFVSAIITSVDIESGVVVLDAPEGLLDP